jgi:hypothetical protein
MTNPNDFAFKRQSTLDDEKKMPETLIHPLNYQTIRENHPNH